MWCGANETQLLGPNCKYTHADWEKKQTRSRIASRVWVNKGSQCGICGSQPIFREIWVHPVHQKHLIPNITSEIELGTTYFINKQQVNIYSSFFEFFSPFFVDSHSVQSAEFAVDIVMPYGVDLHYFVLWKITHNARRYVDKCLCVEDM